MLVVSTSTNGKYLSVLDCRLEELEPPSWRLPRLITVIFGRACSPSSELCRRLKLLKSTVCTMCVLISAACMGRWSIEHGVATYFKIFLKKSTFSYCCTSLTFLSCSLWFFKSPELAEIVKIFSGDGIRQLEEKFKNSM